MKHIKNNVKEKLVKLNGKIFKEYIWSIVNKHLKQTLIDLGCIPNKSLLLKNFPQIDPIYNKDFIRGYFDGDGCISIIKNKPKISIIGTEKFLSNIKNIIDKSKIKSSICIDKRMKNPMRVLNVSLTDGEKFLDYIYYNSSVFLNRKYKRYEFFKNCRSK